MAQLVGLLVSEDDAFRKQIGRWLRSGPVPVGVIDDRAPRDGMTAPDLIVVDIRGDVSHALSSIERLRAAAPGAGIFVIALMADPNLILESMRAGANEFFTWPPPEDQFQSAIRRTASRRETSQGSRQSSNTLVFFGAKGGAGTTTVAVNCGVEVARLSKRSTVIVDLKAGLGEVALFLGVRPRYTIIDAIDNLHRLDREFLRELAVKHKSGLEILAGSENFDRPGSADSGATEELLRLLAKQYEYIVIDAGSAINPVSSAGLFAADQMFLVANPDVPSVRNAQRLLDRVRQLGAAGEATGGAPRVHRAQGQRSQEAAEPPEPRGARAGRPDARGKRDPHARHPARERRGHGDQPRRARHALQRAGRRGVRARSAGTASSRSVHQRYSGQHLQP